MSKREDEHDLREAVAALDRIESGESEVVDWEDAKKEIGINTDDGK
jgi:hypothetical protein